MFSRQNPIDPSTDSTVTAGRSPICTTPPSQGSVESAVPCMASTGIARVASQSMAVTSTMVEVTAIDCDATLAMPVLAIHGTADSTLPWEGGVVQIGDLPAVTVLSVDGSMGFWRENNGCTSGGVVTGLPEIHTTDGRTVSVAE